jgi:hypothetical protein
MPDQRAHSLEFECWLRNPSISAILSNFNFLKAGTPVRKVLSETIQLAACSVNYWGMITRKQFWSCVNIFSKSFSAYCEHNSRSFGEPLQCKKSLSFEWSNSLLKKQDAGTRNLNKNNNLPWGEERTPILPCIAPTMLETYWAILTSILYSTIVKNGIIYYINEIGT